MLQQIITRIHNRQANYVGECQSIKERRQTLKMGLTDDALSLPVLYRRFWPVATSIQKFNSLSLKTNQIIKVQVTVPIRFRLLARDTRLT